MIFYVIAKQDRPAAGDISYLIIKILSNIILLLSIVKVNLISVSMGCIVLFSIRVLHKDDDESWTLLWKIINRFYKFQIK